MTLFDYIRYPISTPVTVEEINGLPAGIIDLWRDRIRCSGITIETHNLDNVLTQMIREAIMEYNMEAEDDNI